MPGTGAGWYQKGSWYNHRGYRIFYVAEGTGQALLLLHGFPTASWDWHKLWGDLMTSYRVIAADFIGFGYSDKPAGYHYSIFDQADLVEGLLDHLGVIEYHILAHDIGDTVAQELLARQRENQSDNIKSCCLLNGGLFPESHRATRTQKLLLGPLGFAVARLMTFDKFCQSFQILFSSGSKLSPEELQDFYGLITFNNGHRNMHRLIQYIIERRRYRERWLSALQQFSGPLVLVDGIDDPVSGAHMVARYGELIPNPRIVELAGCGHYPQTEAPAEVLKVYRKFRM